MNVIVRVSATTLLFYALFSRLATHWSPAISITVNNLALPLTPTIAKLPNHPLLTSITLAPYPTNTPPIVAFPQSCISACSISFVFLHQGGKTGRDKNEKCFPQSGTLGGEGGDGGMGGDGGAKSVAGDVCPVLPLLLFFPPTTMSLVNKATSKLRKFKQFHSKLFDLFCST